MTYYEGVKKMEEMGVNKYYIQGWIAGFLENPEIKEQKIIKEYEAGYEDGRAKINKNFIHYIN